MRVLVVEDVMLLADLIVEELERAGCRVVGPASSVAEGVELASTELLHGALLDVALWGETSMPIADALARRGIPYAFLTGYEESIIPQRHRTKPCLAKPFRARDLLSLLHCGFTRPTTPAE